AGEQARVLREQAADRGGDRGLARAGFAHQRGGAAGGHLEGRLEHGGGEAAARGVPDAQRVHGDRRGRGRRVVRDCTAGPASEVGGADGGSGEGEVVDAHEVVLRILPRTPCRWDAASTVMTMTAPGASSSQGAESRYWRPSAT